MSELGAGKAGILDFVGGTPLVPLERLLPDFDGRLFAKLEGLNPGGSAKDRPALAMLQRAWDRGEIGPGSVIVESSSGNMGIGLAQACARLNLRLFCVVDIKSTEQNRRILEAYGARVVLVTEPDPESGELLQARLSRVKELLDAYEGSYWPNQYANPENANSHYRTTMREIVDSLGAAPDYLFIATSTCGTLRGCVDFIVDQGLTTKVVVVDARGSQIFGQEPRERYIPGLGAGLRPPLCPELPESVVIHVNDLECVEGCRRLVRLEGILAGGSSGALVSALHRHRHRMRPAASCVLVLPDRGERYLDTVYSDDWVRNTLGASRWDGATPLGSMPETGELGVRG